MTSTHNADKHLRRKPGEVENRILELLEEVPAQFTRNDISKVHNLLEPERTLQDWALNNALLKMVRKGTLRVVKQGKAGVLGGNQSVYEVKK